MQIPFVVFRGNRKEKKILSVYELAVHNCGSDPALASFSGNSCHLRSVCFEVFDDLLETTVLKMYNLEINGRCYCC